MVLLTERAAVEEAEASIRITGPQLVFLQSQTPIKRTPRLHVTSISTTSTNYRGFEEQLIEQAQNDTSLIDQAREDVEVAQGLAAGISSRNASRYGASLTPAQMQQQQRQLQRANTLGGIQSVNDARIAQREANTRLLGDLINIGQGVNRSSLDQMGAAAADATQRKNAYSAAKAQSRANTYSTIGSLGAMAIMAFAF